MLLCKKRKDAGEIIFKNFKQVWVKPFLAPFLKNKKEQNTTILSPAAMMKTCLTFTDATTLAKNYSVEKIANTGSNAEDLAGADTAYNADNGKWHFIDVKRMV